VPTTNVRPEITGSGIWDQLMLFLYQVDAADNLFPSIHCLVSWLCYIGLRGRQNVPAGYRFFSCVMAVAVCISTLTTRQHVLADVAGGILLAEGCYRFTRVSGFAASYGRFFEKLTGWFARKTGHNTSV
jgi:membrane-associated phospholipid phosphatase